ncbi:DHH family phosphoesterase [Bailinhaonella thermotolerans]|uniref:DHH family phosphoesterase n=1 Tax=Bailinhaonella thermotolerans TaxID=1070861 RepID=UPI001F5C084E|nr:DHH family phosphoesterase [Bailinhaonella thermotolerans]
MTGLIADADWDHAVKLIESAPQVHLACHIVPDGDALGSMLALGLALRELGKPCVASFGDEPFTVPRLLRFLPGQDLLVPPAEVPEAPRVMFTFDAASAERLGALAAKAAKAEELVVVDHHRSNTGFGSLHLVSPSAAATAVIVAELIDRLGVPFTRDIATCLYVGLVTDTGSFRYSSTNRAVHELAGRLVATGIRTDEIARELWDRSPFAYLPVLGAALGRAVLDRDAAGGRGMVWTYVSRADRAAHDLSYDEIEGVIDVVRRTDEAEVAVVVKEDDEGAWQVSTRSKGAIDVGRACAALGGGGHASAAGFTSHLPVEVTIAKFRELLA